MSNLLGKTRGELSQTCLDLGLPAVHAKTLYRNLFKKGQSEPWSCSTLPRKLQSLGAASWSIALPQVVAEHVSAYDQSVKFVVELLDGAQVECVLMPEKERITLCVSSQVGCAQGCVFCHTGRMGLKRHLSADEIVGQIFMAIKWVEDHPQWLEHLSLPAELRVTNVVFMGMGEPLDNCDEIFAALDVMTDPYGMAIGPKHVSVSTAGYLPGMLRLLRERPQVQLALSLHSPYDGERSRIMPINRRFPIAMVIEALKEFYPKDGKRALLVQYTLIDNVNDSLEHADAVFHLLAPIAAKVNIIPLNEIEPARFRSPHPERLQQFRDVLHTQGLRTLVRYSKGQDIAAACGQLIVK